MGLAAAQARFLGITMRKADCEYRSTELAQQKLEITNQLADIAQDYSNSMNATHLVWSNEALGADVNLAYSLLMMPSVANDYNPYLITTTSGAVVLNNEFAAAAKAAGISMTGGTPSQDGRDKFIAALVAGGVATKETADSISTVNWNAIAGLGGEPMDKTSTSVMTLSDMILDNNIGGRVVNLLSFGENDKGGIPASEEYIAQIRDADERSKYVVASTSDDWGNFTTYSKEGKYTLVNNGSQVKDIAYLKELTIADILSDEVVIMTTTDDKNNSSDTFINDIKLILQNIAKMFGYGQRGVGLNVDDASEKAITSAIGMVESHYLKSGNIVKSGNTRNTNSLYSDSAYMNAISNNRIGGYSERGGYMVSLTGLVSAFLTYYDNELRGGSSPYFVGRSLETSNMITDDYSYQYITGISASSLISSEEKVADFYDQVYNNICARGWREDATLDDNEYFESSIKNGRYSLTSLNNDGYFYQTRYNETGYLVEESDPDAIARAEAEYTRKKAELTYKEDYIDLKNKNLDAEIAELTTEMESVKGIISKSIEKTFSMFQQ